ncbi:hypothetical protein [Deinococcus ruber]|nr:hypothetical protein [Deinococcus ruber]
MHTIKDLAQTLQLAPRTALTIVSAYLRFKGLPPQRQAYNSYTLTPELFDEICQAYHRAVRIDVSFARLLDLTSLHLPELLTFATLMDSSHNRSLFRGLDPTTLRFLLHQLQAAFDEPVSTPPLTSQLMEEMQQIKRNQELLLVAIQKVGRTPNTPLLTPAPNPHT